MNDTLQSFFKTRGAELWPAEPGPDFPSEESFAAYLDDALPLTERRAFEARVLRDPAAYALLRCAVDVLAEAERPVSSSTRILASIKRHGLQLLNAMELSFQTLRDGQLRPALGALRGEAGDESFQLLRIDGPGHGLDELELSSQSDGSVQLTVRGREPLQLQAGEISSIVLEAEGEPREKRPFSGEPLGFTPLGHGRYTLRLVARAPGHPLRELACAHLELSA
ncbi:MAG: hypothetical protein DHS20C15_18450 [Planctomycetota bacterium]|nr:MAG: hypothetical protein DHS20C15_18450 [Planctomycetota bacterium]